MISAIIWAQSPEKISYQSVIRNSNNELVANQSVGMKISILRDSISGVDMYVETHTTSTNTNGLVSIEIGNGTVQSGEFATIDWGNGTYFIKTETDPTGGSAYTITGTSQLLSVPYALHAKTAEKLGGSTATNVTYFPQSAYSGGSAFVSFSGNSGINFSQASPIALQFEQASPIYPSKVRYINHQKVDVFINIPWNAATGRYNLIINPNEASPNILENAFLID
jgi:hypothetical protein